MGAYGQVAYGGIASAFVIAAIEIVADGVDRLITWADGRDEAITYVSGQDRIV